MQVDGQEKEAVGLPLNSQQRKENLDTISEAFLKIEMPFEELFYSSLDLFIHTVLGGQAAAVGPETATKQFEESQQMAEEIVLFLQEKYPLQTLSSVVLALALPLMHTLGEVVKVKIEE